MHSLSSQVRIMAPIKFRVETVDELAAITETVDYPLDGKSSTIRALINSLNLNDCDIQLHEKIMIITGNVSIKNTSFSMYKPIVPIYGFEISDQGLLKIVLDCSKIALPNGVNNIAFQLIIER